MESVLIYSPYWLHFGGGDRYMLYLAVAISKLPGTEVTLLGEFEKDSKEQYQKFFNLDLSGISFDIIQDYSRSLKNIASAADIFISQSNFRTIKANPKNYVLALQIPYARITPLSMGKKCFRGDIKDAAKDVFRLRLLQFARKDARLVLSNSQFVHDTLRRNFEIESHVLYPPEDLSLEGISKRNIILSVGRFFRGLYNDKRYDILTECFRRMVKEGFSGWEYHIVGSCSPQKKPKKFLDGLREANAGFPVFFHVNEPHDSLLRFYNQAKILWHAAGFQVDEVRNPEKVEHFGSVAVEALSAKCIPIVVNNGGLKEIVQHGKNGFLWDTIDELAHFTRHTANLSSEELQLLQENAVKRFQSFATISFNEQVANLFSPLLAP